MRQATSLSSPLVMVELLELAGVVRGVSRMKVIFSLVLLLWVVITLLDFYSANFR